MKKNIHHILLGFIILLALILRLWQLGIVPISPDWDEVALGYNAYSILHTGRDEYGKFLPVVLRSFDDYKPALYSYLIVPLLSFLDLNVFTVRLPSAIMGTVTVLAVYFLVKELLQTKSLEIMDKKIPADYVALVSSLLLAISPWHLQFSRVAFETNVGMGFNVLMALCFFKGLKSPKYYLPLAAVFGALSIYTYQSEKVFTPLLLLGLVVIYSRTLFKHARKYLIAAVITGLIVIAPMAYETVTNKEALARARGVSIFSDKTTLLKSNVQRLIRDREQNDYMGLVFDNRRVIYGQTILANYLSHFDPVWMFIKGDYDVDRHHAPNMGLEYLVLLPFLLMGLYRVLFLHHDRRVTAILFYWLLIAPIPASITTGVPHAVRTLNYLPVLQIFIAFGLLSAVFMIIKYVRFTLVRYAIFGVLIALFSLNVGYYLNQYFVQQNYYYTSDWQYGYEELIAYLRPRQQDYKKIIVSNSGEMSQSYMFFLFYTKYDP